ncbi:FG-GAP-like repeat-containing protein [Caulobacter sp. BK020]|uniref:beta strand repeat-containing protein n=1 Tax=Caulobacter sp. BK020 TaxID=2512117 RepID=UPI001A9E6F52|nr:FG-GAP-like repeat-containing protein [Caulobacter sp. BK020]
MLQIPYARYELGAVTVTNNGNRDLVTSMATTARDTLNGLIAMVAYTNTTAYVSNLNGSSTTQKYGHTGGQIYVTINGVQTNFGSADQAVEFGTLAAIRNTKIVGGDIFAKRVIARSPAADLTSLTGDLQIASDYRFYASNRALIDGFIKGAYATLTEAEQSYYASNKALIDKAQTQGTAALTSGELSTYNANKPTIDKIIGALENQVLANPWIITLERAVNELGLAKWTASDFYGGLQGFLGSFDLAGHGVAFENVRLAASGAGAVVSLRGGSALEPFAASTKAHVGFGTSAASGGWASQDLNPRFLADVNGDGRQDMVGVGNSQVIVELGQANGTFGGGLVASTNLTAAVNWTSQNISPRMAGDVNGDGRADLVGFGGDGTYVMLGQANGAFGAVFKANAGYGSTGGAGGWSSQDAYPRFLADVNGDGRTDVVGVGGSIVLVSLGQADGTFANGVVASSQFTGAAGWAGQDRDPRTAADVNGDGRADLVGFADDGVYVALGQANGTFAASYKAITAFGYAAGGWSSFNANPRYVKDMNGDGRADIVGYGNGALYVSLAQADGMFAPHQIFSTPYVADAGWGPQSIQPRMIGDVDGDGMMDLVAVGTDGVYVQRGDRASAGLFSILPSAAQGGQSVSIDSLAAIGYGAVAPGSTTSGNDLVDRSLATGGLTIDDNHTEIETTYQYYWNGWDYDVVETQTPVTRDGGDDIFVGGAGDDTLYGRAGWDWLDGGAGDDTLDGGSQNDTLLGAAGKDLLRGGDGDDYIAGGDGHEGGDGQGGGLFGGAGNDVLVGGAGMDGLWGEDGDDTFIVDEDGGATYDSFIGGAGSNTISYERFSAGVGIDLGARSPSDSSQHIWYGDYFWDVENATGTAFNDTMVGDAIGNILKGGAGADSIGGRDGGDILEGGAGADFLWGDGGYDWVQYTGSSAGVYIDLSTGEAFGGDADGDVFDSIESVSGSKLADQLKGDAGDNYLVGKEGDDWLVATTGADMLIGDEGKDFVDYSAATAGVSLNLGGYTPTGQATGSGYSGLAASQSYIGVEGVVGSAYADSLSAGDGDQTFVGGAGNDTLSGGAGTDTYVLNLGDGADTIVEDNGGWNILSLGEGIKASDLVMGTAGGTNGWLSVTVRGGNASAYVGGNFAQLTNARVKTIDFNGGGQLDIGSVDYAVGGVTDGADTLVGLGGEHYDLIIGLNGDDTIWGRASGQLESTGNVIIGGLGNDTINTSNGDDQFAYDRAGLDANGAVIANVDTITDAGGEDTLVFGSTVTAQDVIYQVVGNDLYIGAKDAANPTLTASQVADRVKIVGGGVKWVETDPYGEPMGGSFINTVEYVVAGGTSIDLRKLDIAWTVQTYVNYSNYYPVALDLDGDGLDLSTVEASSVVVKTAQGGISQIAWVGPADGLLAVDRDGDGAINRLSEISFVQDRPGATSDLEGLRTWDSNGDGLLDKADKDFGRILLFVDANQNGRSTAKELRTLEEAGIKAINLGGTATGYTAAMTTESFVQNTISFVWADGREGQGYDVALARRVLGSEGLYAGEYQAEWGARDEDGTLGQLLNDPKTAAKAARIKARKGLLDRLGASYDEVKAAAQLDFSDTDKVDASVARRWKKMDASQRAAWLSGQATGLDDQSNLAALKAVSSGQALAKALNDSARAGRDLVDRGLAQAGAVVSPGDPSRPSGGGSTTAQGLGVDFGAASGLLSGLGGGLGGGLTASQPLDGVVQADATIGQDQAWWRGQTDGGLAGAGSLAGLLAAMDQGVGDRAPGARSASDDPALTQQQRLLRQAMAGFGGQAGGSAAIWNRDAAQASAVLAAAGQPTTPLALNLALAS